MFAPGPEECRVIVRQDLGCGSRENQPAAELSAQETDGIRSLSKRYERVQDRSTAWSWPGYDGERQAGPGA